MRIPSILVALALFAASTPALAADAERGLKKCRICHGEDLAGKKHAPGIAGMPAKKILRTLTDKVPKRMAPVVRGLSPEEKKAIAEHVSKLEQGTPAPEAP